MTLFSRKATASFVTSLVLAGLAYVLGKVGLEVTSDLAIAVGALVTAGVAYVVPESEDSVGGMTLKPGVSLSEVVY